MDALLTTASTSSETLETVPLSIMDKDGRVTPYKPNVIQQHFRANRARRELILKPRQVGISTEIQAGLFRTAITTSSLQATLAHDDETTQKLRRMAERFWKYLPDHLRPKRGLDNKTTTTYLDTGSEVTIATAGSVHKGRGGTYTHFHGSEVAFWKDAGETMAGILQGVSNSGHITLESTPNGAQGWFFDQCMQALDGDPAWKLHFYPWWWQPEYRIPLHPDESSALINSYSDDEQALAVAFGLTPEQIAWRRKKQRDLGIKFAQEYPEDPRTCFLLSGMGYFSDALHGVFIAPQLDGPVEGHRNVAGLDFAQTNDYTVCSAFDADEFQQRAILRINRLPWVDMRQRIIEFCDRWGVSLILAERNAMGPNVEALASELPSHITLRLFLTDPQTKPPLIGGLRVALAEEGLQLLDDPDQKRELNAFQANQLPSGHWQYAAPAGEHDDTVIAAALAVHAIHAAPMQMFRMKRGRR